MFGLNFPLERLVALSLTDCRPVDHLTPMISVMSVERKVTMHMTVTATAATTAGPDLDLGPEEGTTHAAGVTAGVKGGGPGPGLVLPGGPGPGPGPGLGPVPGLSLEVGADLDPWDSPDLDLVPEVVHHLLITVRLNTGSTDQQMMFLITFIC